MLIEYKIKFEEDGLTIAQRIEPNSVRRNGVANNNVKVNGLPAAQHEVRALAPTNPLTELSAKDVASGPGDETTGPGDETTGPGDETTGQGGQGSAPIFILGPIVFGGSVPREHERRHSIKEPPPPEGRPKALGKAAGSED